MASYSWVKVLPTNPLTVSYTHCLERISSRCTPPGNILPSLVLFLSNDAETTYGPLFKNYIPPRRVLGSLLSIKDCLDGEASCPILAIHGKIKITKGTLSSANAGLRSAVSTGAATLSAEQLACFVYARLVIPYASTIFISSSDFSSTARLVEYLSQLNEEVIRTIPFTRPSLNVLLMQGQAVTPELAGMCGDLSFFATVEIHREISPTNSLIHYVRRNREARVIHHTLLPLSSLCNIWVSCFQSALERENPMTENLVLASRKSFPVCAELSYYLADFIADARSVGLSEPDIHRLIASALIFDAYTFMDHWFESKVVFKVLYEKHCIEALYGINDCIQSSLACDKIAKQFNLLYQNLLACTDTPQSIRQSDMNAYRFLWSRLKFPSRKCFYCLQGRPEQRLPCSHLICRTCIRRLAQADLQIEGKYFLPLCPICSTEIAFEATVQPTTAGIRILSIDGGGICGIIPLDHLLLLEQKLTNGLSIHDLFDLVIGTSAGGMILLSIFHLGRSAADSKGLFHDLSQAIFLKPRNLRQYIKSFCRLILRDGYYDSSQLDQILQKVYGSSGFSEIEASLGSNTKMAVTTADTARNELYLITNYSKRHTSDEKGYETLSPSSNDIPLWKAARATSAAPTFFSATDIGCLGFFQDGGLRANNPSRVGIREAQNIWGRQYPVDVIASLGTGVHRDHAAPSLKLGLRDSAIPRLIRHIKTSTDGTRTHQELLGSLTERHLRGYTRLDIELPRSIKLDAVEEMMGLSRLVRDAAGTNLDQLLLNLLASTFCLTNFQVDYVEGGCVRYTYRLSCRLKAISVVNCLTGYFGTIFLVRRGVQIGTLAPANICGVCQSLNSPLEDATSGLEGVVDLSLKTESGLSSAVSANGQTLAWFVEQEQVEKKLRSHWKALPPCGRCIQRVKRKREKGDSTGRRTKRSRTDKA